MTSTTQEVTAEQARELVPQRLGRLYSNALENAQSVARELGYAVAVHGSQIRDLDLVAVPWVEDACSPDELAEAIRSIVGGVYSGHATALPHGRIAYSIKFPAQAKLHAIGPYIDLSVMSPRAVQAQEG
jgi:hypothetical protein